MYDITKTRMLLTTVVFAAIAALMVGPASAYSPDVEGGDGSGSATAVTRQPDAYEQAVEMALATHPATPGALQSAVTHALAEIAAEASAKQAAQSSATLAPIPSLSHVVGEEPAGLMGDSPRTRWQPYQANATFASNGDTDVNWTWVGLGAGMAALLAAAMGALYLSARNRDRVALP
jgi:hypothetical protein